ncbi:TetR/AcrR family transcriptional regulator [Lactobacillus alvi]|uniref:TetR/AcrR family transcriptional regulator n=1 Tax=Limosilactobacillus alvi TaxID=990412 RepID=A0ABS2ELT1_9LACO|nr:TetR/AcrR family transcriptional regulator [Limosilactobacillus alvi]MBM6753210.1 TetR/AcrR family transcriptional regulator [Limosilactobacillus alvi]
MKMNRTVRDFERALTALLEEQHFEKITVNEICEEALLHRSSFYRYFRDKYDLLEQTIKHRLNILVEKSETEDNLIEAVVDSVAAHNGFYKNLTRSGSRDSLYTEVLRIYSEILMDIKENGPKNTIIYKALNTTKQPKLLAYSLGGAIIGTFYWWQNQNFDVPKGEVVSFFKEIVDMYSKADK